MKYLYKLLNIFLFSFLLAGCAEFDIQPSEETDDLVTLSLLMEDMVSVKAVPPDTDEGEGDSYCVSDFWMFEYKSDGTIAGSPRYFEVDGDTDDIPVPVLLPPAGATYKCIIIANTHDSNFTSGLTDFSTLTAMQKEYRNISRYSDLYQVNGDVSDLLMNGSVDISSNSAEISCVLYRNVARLDVSLVNDASSGIIINSIQVKNVCDHMFYYDRAYSGAQTPSPTTAQSGFVNMPVIQVDAGGSSTVNDFRFYLPRNMRGTNQSLDESGKNSGAPEHSTYIEVMATNAASDSPLRYRFYPGKNMVNDFNIEPNHHYSLTINFSGIGDQYIDNRVEDMSSVVLEESNSYIIHPLPTDAQVTYAVPLSRINRFWESGVGMMNPDYQNYVLDASVEWVAEVIWQDYGGRVIEFCDHDGTVRAGDVNFEGKGEGFFYFKPVKAAFGHPCNVIIGVKRKGASVEEGYMWSWHLWLTDYDPDEEVGSWETGKYIYEVEGGAVHRYAGTYWMNNHYNKYIMDRNLGARSAERSAGLAENAGFATQFGRKDVLPMSGSYQMYDINGAEIADCIKKVVGPVDMYQGVMNPTTFYMTMGTISSPHGDWIRNNAYGSTGWNNIGGVMGQKSIFDPCPPGWTLPKKGTWQNFAGDGQINAVPDSWSGVTNGWDLYIGEGPSSGTAFYPAAGWRNLSSGTLGFQQASEYWSSEPSSNVVSGQNLYLRNSLYDSYGIPSANYRSYGMSIRCIQE